MASSSYYYSEMLDYSRAKRSSEEKKTEYESYIKKLKLLFANLEGVYGNLVACDDAFNSGGYIVNGVTLDQGALYKNYVLLATVVTNLDDVILKTQNRIEAISNDVKRYSRLYNQAKTNYENALRRESMN